MHSLVSILAYYIFTKRIEGFYSSPPVTEVTSPDEHRRGEASFMTIKSRVVRTITPIPVLYYVFFGYLGIVSSLVVAIFSQLTGRR